MEMGVPPDSDEFEFTLIGPGYGESIILHLGGGVWVLVDSNVDKDGNPGSLQYLESIGCDPAQSVALIVASHWHDDHIRGMEKMVKVPVPNSAVPTLFATMSFLPLSLPWKADTFPWPVQVRRRFTACFPGF